MTWIEKEAMGQGLRDAFAVPANDPFADLIAMIDKVEAELEADQPAAE